MKTVLKTCYIYFIEFLIPEIPNLLQILSFVIIVLFFLPNEYNQALTIVYPFLMLYLFVKLFLLLKKLFYKYSILELSKGIKIFACIFVVLMALTYYFFGLVIEKIIIATALEDKLSTIERKTILKQASQDDVNKVLEDLKNKRK